ncbi:MAG: CSLREA domain-containing protein [Chloroflexota bacterium]|nr:CSLREA domain-containing protein [Chloroflexota bacterium]
MQINHYSSRFRIITLIAIIVMLAIPSPASADSFVVNTTDDADDGTCDANHCSLREAINAANQNPGADTIAFNIIGSSPYTIQVASVLPAISDDGTMIDGTTQPGYPGTPLIMLEPGYPAPFNSDNTGGLTIASSGNVVKGLSIVGFIFNSNRCFSYSSGGGAIVILSGTGNLIDSNYLGLTPSGNAYGNTIGVYIHSDAPGQTINNNVVSGNYCGIAMKADSQVVQNNLVGTDPSGVSGIGNTTFGIQSSRNNLLIGGPGQGNVVSGNAGYGISLASVPLTNSHNIIQGNFIGTDITGSSPIPNGLSGLSYFEGEGGTIGGINPGEGNIFAFNGYHGIDLLGNGQYVKGNEVFGNGRSGVRLRKNDVISRNSIYSNGGLGIENNEEDATPLPILQQWNGPALSGTACPGCIVEIFIADPDPTHHGEGKEYLGSAQADNNGHFLAYLDLEEELPFCSHLTGTATDNRSQTSPFAWNMEVKCFRIPSLFLIPIWSFIITVFGVFGILIRRRRPGGSRWIVPGSLTLGALGGAGLIFLGGMLPNVIIDFQPEQAIPYQGQLPSCKSYLDPSGFSPQDGATLELADDVFLEWAPTGNLPEGDIQWTVHLEEVTIYTGMQTTGETPLPMSAFSMMPTAGAIYEWSLLGQRLLQDGETWLPFCAADEPWVFSIEEEISEESEAEGEESEEPACTSPLITALKNMTCRKGPDQLYEEAGYLLQGETAVPEGVSMDTFWYWIPNPDWLGYCFVAGNGVQAECIDGLPPIAAPPLPTATPTQAACLPTLDRSACNDAGGIWEVATSTCICP